MIFVRSCAFDYKIHPRANDKKRKLLKKKKNPSNDNVLTNAMLLHTDANFSIHFFLHLFFCSYLGEDIQVVGIPLIFALHRPTLFYFDSTYPTCMPTKQSSLYVFISPTALFQFSYLFRFTFRTNDSCLWTNIHCLYPVYVILLSCIQNILFFPSPLYTIDKGLDNICLYF